MTTDREFSYCHGFSDPDGAEGDEGWRIYCEDRFVAFATEELDADFIVAALRFFDKNRGG